MNEGMVIKRNSNQRYATNVITGVIMREIARTAGLQPIQEFLVRQDCGCGSTIGPTISAATGMYESICCSLLLIYHNTLVFAFLTRPVFYHFFGMASRDPNNRYGMSATFHAFHSRDHGGL
jgi:Aminopeptidase I zinc metalloprotease (M18)